MKPVLGARKGPIRLVGNHCNTRRSLFHISELSNPQDPADLLDIPLHLRHQFLHG